MVAAPRKLWILDAPARSRGVSSPVMAIERFDDLIELLQTHPEWRQQLRQLVLTDELLGLPDLVADLAGAQRESRPPDIGRKPRASRVARGATVMAKRRWSQRRGAPRSGASGCTHYRTGHLGGKSLTCGNACCVRSPGVPAATGDVGRADGSADRAERARQSARTWESTRPLLRPPAGRRKPPTGGLPPV